MDERAYLRDFVSQAEKGEMYYIEKIGDTFGGHKKPYDGYIFHRGRAMCFEAKNENGTLSEHQEKRLIKAERYGDALTFVFRFRRNEKHGRNMHCYLYRWGQELPHPYILEWKSGKYPEIDYLPDNLKQLAKKLGRD